MSPLLLGLAEFVLRWMHFFFGIMWIGHLYYFNFTQGTFLASSEVNNISKADLRIKLLPVALWWFRWGAMWTVVTGLLYLALKGHELGANFFVSSYGLTIGVGAILGITMWYNVWFVIWPKQQIVIKNAETVAKGQPALPAAAAAAARANVASRTNTLLSIPMLFFMGAASHLPLPISDSSNLLLFWLLFAAVWAVVEYNAIAGQTYKVMTTVQQVITSGFVLTGVIVALLYASL